MRIHYSRVLLCLLLLTAILFLFMQLKSVDKNFNKEYNPRSGIDSSAKRINITSIEYLRRSSICLFRKPKIIILVTSYIFNVNERNAIRRSYPKDLFDKFNAQILFMVAVAPKFNLTFKRLLDDEFKQNDDIIQGIFFESYRNLTYKHLMGFKWVNDFCKSAEYIVKMDDDIAVNYYKLFQLVNAYKSKFELMGHVLDHMKPIRNEHNKWYVTKEEYQDEKYPEFLSGWIYVATFNSVRSILKHAHLSSYFWIDDLFVTGILREKANIKLTDIRQHFRYEPKNIECCVLNKYSCNFLAAPNGKNFNLTLNFFHHLWECRYKTVCLLENNFGTSCWWSEKLAAEELIKFKEQRFKFTL